MWRLVMTATINESQDVERDIWEVEWKEEGVESPVHSPWKHEHERHRAMHLPTLYLLNQYMIKATAATRTVTDCL